MRRLVAAGLAAALSVGVGFGQDTPEPDPLSGLTALLDATEAAWQQRDVEAYLAQWDFVTSRSRQAEAELAASHFAAGSSELRFARPSTVPPGVRRAHIGARVSSVTEPRGRFEQYRFTVRRDPDRWRLVEREGAGEVDGLLHLSLARDGFRADGLRLRLEDFELTMERGTLFLPPESVGPTVLVFVGEGRVRVTPRPATEREQLRQFSGSTELDESVESAFVRIHPADLHRILVPVRLEPDPDASKRYSRARKVFEEHVGRSFVLDAPLPGSPWWVLPALGDAMVSFDTGRRGTLTFAVNRSEPESLSLFDRDRRRQICLYPGEGGTTRYSEDDGRAVDVVSHDISLRFEPEGHRIEGSDTLRLKLLASTSSFRLRLASSLDIRSITDERGEGLLFFRVRHQDSVLVSLGPNAGRLGEMSLRVSYAGSLPPSPVQDETLQVFEPPRRSLLAGIRLEPVVVYANRRPWYPQANPNDYATARLRFDVPAGDLAVTGGRRVSQQTSQGRTQVEYVMDRPGKYFSVAIGRLGRVAARALGGTSIETHAVPRMEKEARALTTRAGEILAFYETQFGPVPYPDIELVVVEGEVPGGHSPPGMVIVQRRPVVIQGSLQDDPASFHDVEGFYLAHELAHQWWGQAVAGENYHERWLSEAMAQYAAALWARSVHGEDEFEDILKRFERWSTRFSDEGPISLGYRLGHVAGDPQVFRAIVYDKGAYVLHMLRGVVGPEAFRAGLTALQAQHRFSKVGTHDLFAALERASGRDLEPYAQAWVRGTEIMQLNWWAGSRQAEGTWRTRVTVQGVGVPGPVPVEIRIRTNAGERRESVELSDQGGLFEFETADKPRDVELNADRGLLARVRRR